MRVSRDGNQSPPLPLYQVDFIVLRRRIFAVKRKGHGVITRNYVAVMPFRGYLTQNPVVPPPGSKKNSDGPSPSTMTGETYHVTAIDSFVLLPSVTQGAALGQSEYSAPRDRGQVLAYKEPLVFLHYVQTIET